MLNLIQNLPVKTQYCLLYIFYILTNFAIFNNFAFGDDFYFLFHSHEIKDLKNPLLYFFPWSDYFKSWSFTYFVMWLMEKLFGEELYLYRLVNFSLHFINFILLEKCLKALKLNFRWSLLYLFSPLAVLTTAWIFQIKTLLASFFILLILLNLFTNNLEQLKTQFKIIVLFLFSTLSKTSGILLPVFILIYIIKKKLSTKKIVSLTLPLFLISILFGFINIKGITHKLVEIAFINKDIVKNEIIVEASNSKVQEVNKRIDKAHDEINFDINVIEEINDSTNIYFNFLTSSNDVLKKYLISLQNLGRFFFSSVGLNNYLPFYENHTKTVTSPLFFLYGFMGLGIIFFLLFSKNIYLFLTCVLFLPISGMFYIPYMKFSYASDHWFYTPLLGSIFIFSQIKNTKVFQYTFFITFLSYSLTVYKYTSFRKALTLNESFHENRIINEHHLKYNLPDSEAKERVNTLLRYFLTTEQYNLQYADTILQYAHERKNDAIARAMFSTHAKRYIEMQSLKNLQQFTINYLPFFTDRELELTESFNTIYTHKITNELYQRTIEHLQ